MITKYIFNFIVINFAILQRNGLKRGRSVRYKVDGGGGGGGGVNRFSDRRISQKKLFGFRILANILHGFVDLINTADCGFI